MIKDKSFINMIAVARFQKYDGYERIIIPLAEYNTTSSTKFILHFVGEGEELLYYKKLVKRHKIEEYVVFYGSMMGKKLDEVYEKMDIALGPFGLYKRVYHHKVGISGALKTREYLLKGLPVVSGCEEDILSGTEVPFFLQFPSDSSLVELGIIAKFYKNLYRDYTKDTLKKETVEFCKKHADINVTMKPVIEYLQNNIMD